MMATMKDEFLEGAGGIGHRSRRRQGPLEAERRRRRLLLQQVPRRLLRADRLPHRLPQGQLPGRVHGGRDLLGDDHQGQGALLRQPLRRDGDRGAAAGRQLLRPRLRRLRATRSASASTRSRTSATPRSRRSCARGRTPRSTRSGTSASGSTARAVNKRAIECLIKCGALDSTGATRRGMLEVLPAGAVGGPEGPGGRAAGSGLDLRPRRGAGAGAHGDPARTTGRRSPPTSSSSASCWRSRRRRSAPSSPSTR